MTGLKRTLEHPELVAPRMCRYAGLAGLAGLAGRQVVMAGAPTGR
jgi:hypothetical protein